MLSRLAGFVVFVEARALKPVADDLEQRHPFQRGEVHVGEHEANTLKVFPAVAPCGVDHSTTQGAVCGKAGPAARYPPVLVSLDRTKVAEYHEAVCETSQGWEYAQKDLAVTVTKVSGGETCVYIPSSRVGYSMHREVWNSTHAMLLGDWENRHFMSAPERESATKNKRSKMDIDDDLMIVPYAHFHTIYAHSLLDFLPQAYVTFDLVNEHKLKILIGSNLQRRLLMSTGLDSRRITSPMAQEDQVLCVRNGRSIYVMETNLKDRHAYYYHRILGYRGVGQQVAAAMVGADLSSRLRGTSRRPAVVFLGRCGAAARRMDNEDAAFSMVEFMMKRKGRNEELVRFCGDGGQPDAQAATLSRATAVVGQHGGAMANLLYLTPGCSTRIIEFVQPTPFIPPGQNPAPQGRYKSFYYFGAGAPFDYRLVLMDQPNATASLHVRLDDLAKALNEIW